MWEAKGVIPHPQSGDVSQLPSPHPVQSTAPSFQEQGRAQNGLD